MSTNLYIQRQGKNTPFDGFYLGEQILVREGANKYVFYGFRGQKKTLTQQSLA